MPRLPIYNLPPCHSHHILDIQHKASNETEAKMIDLALGCSLKSKNDGNSSVPGLSEKKDSARFSQNLFDGMSVKDFIAVINRYRETTFIYFNTSRLSEGDEVGSSLQVESSVKKQGEMEIDGTTYRNVYVVNLSLNFKAKQTEGAAFFDKVCGYPEQWSYARKQRVILNSSGKVLSINLIGEPSFERIDIRLKSHTNYNSYWSMAYALSEVDINETKNWIKSLPNPTRVHKGVMARVVSREIRDLEQAFKSARDWAKSGQASPSHEHRPERIIYSVDRRISIGDCYGCKERFVARDWAFMEPQQAANWALLLDDSLARDTALLWVARSWVKKDPEAMGAWFRENISPSEKKDLFLSDVVNWMAEDMPATIVKLLPHFEDDEMRESAQRRIADRWSYRQPWLAGELILTMKPGKHRMRLIKELARIWSYHGDAEKAKAWMSNIIDEEERLAYSKSLVPKS